MREIVPISLISYFKGNQHNKGKFGINFDLLISF